VIRSIAAIAALVLVGASFSGGSEQPQGSIPTGMPQPLFETKASGPFALAEVEDRARRLGPGAPPWARRLYADSLRVLIAFTDPGSGALVAGARESWDYVWPRDAAAGAIALQAAGLRPEARKVAGFLAGRDLDAARFYPDGERAPGRPGAGDAAGWVAAAERVVDAPTSEAAGIPGGRVASVGEWRDRQDYGENLTGDLLGNAIASGAPASDVTRFETSRGLVREHGTEALDSSAAWAVVPFANPSLFGPARRTLLALVRRSTPFGIAPMEGWSPGEVWTAPTAWSAWSLVELGERRAADRLLAELRRAATPAGTLPERVDADSGRPTSTTPLAWSHAFAALALLARYPPG
jgi:glucoamylase